MGTFDALSDGVGQGPYIPESGDSVDILTT